jgi:hypothetical protein
MIGTIDLKAFPFLFNLLNQFRFLHVIRRARASTALQYWLSACATALLHTSVYDFDHHEHASVEQAIRKPIKVKSKVTLRFAGA